MAGNRWSQKLVGWRWRFLAENIAMAGGFEGVFSGPGCLMAVNLCVPAGKNCVKRMLERGCCKFRWRGSVECLSAACCWRQPWTWILKGSQLRSQTSATNDYPSPDVPSVHCWLGQSSKTWISLVLSDVIKQTSLGNSLNAIATLSRMPARELLLILKMEGLNHEEKRKLIGHF